MFVVLHRKDFEGRPLGRMLVNMAECRVYEADGVVTIVTAPGNSPSPILETFDQLVALVGAKSVPLLPSKDPTP